MLACPAGKPEHAWLPVFLWQNAPELRDITKPEHDSAFLQPVHCPPASRKQSSFFFLLKPEQHIRPSNNHPTTHTSNRRRTVCLYSCFFFLHLIFRRCGSSNLAIERGIRHRQYVYSCLLHLVHSGRKAFHQLPACSSAGLLRSTLVYRRGFLQVYICAWWDGRWLLKLRWSWRSVCIDPFSTSSRLQMIPIGL